MMVSFLNEHPHDVSPGALIRGTPDTRWAPVDGNKTHLGIAPEENPSIIGSDGKA